MKFSFMSFSTPELSLADMCAAAKQYGYDGLEPRMDAEHAHGIEVSAAAAQRADARAQADAAGVPLVCLATSLRYADPEQTDDMIRQTHDRIDLAGDVGIPRMRVFGGTLAEGLERAEAIELVARSLADVADHATERGVTLCMETHDDWCDPEHVAAVLQRVNHPAIACNWDIMHPVRMGLATMDDAFAAVRPWIRHLHVHDGVTEDGKLRMVPIGEGAIDHKRALELLQTIDYDGYISGEWINWEPHDQHLPREVATLKAYK